MKILLTCNGLLKGNGLRSAVLSLKSKLQEEGLEVKILSSINDDKYDVQPDFPLGHFIFPIFEPIVATNGFRYAKIEKPIIREAIEWADVVHVIEGFPLQSEVVKIAKEMGKPCVGTYHIFAENVTANLGLNGVKFIGRLINKLWWNWAYNQCKIIQCPTQKVKEYLVHHGYTSKLEVISNGVEISGTPTLANEPSVKPYRIFTIGRLANEKSHTTLIDAMRYSKYAANIELHFAGKGPKANKIKKAAYKLFKDGIVKHKPVFGYYTPGQLKELLKTSYLYVHCATVEVEGLSCLEAIREGVVPVIANARLSATSQFALDERSLFKAKDAKSLAQSIDWWIEHPNERDFMSCKYLESAAKYDIRKSTQQIIGMYKEAIEHERY